MKQSFEKPLTDPADLWKLIGRFSASFVLMRFMLQYVWRQNTVGIVLCGVLSVGMQISALSLRKKLVRDREIEIQKRGGSSNNV